MKVKKVYFLMEYSKEKHVLDKPVMASFEPIDIKDESLKLSPNRTYEVFDFTLEE